MKSKNRVLYYCVVFFSILLISLVSYALPAGDGTNECDDSTNKICEKYTAPSGAYVYKCTSCPEGHHYCSKDVGDGK